MSTTQTGLQTSKILFVGDVHGSADVFRWLKQNKFATKDDVVIQVGDFFADQIMMKDFKSVKFPAKVYFIDGNHEVYKYHRTFKHTNGLFRLAPNLFHVQRGSVLEILGKRIAFLGGANSVDLAAQERKGTVVSPDEEITEKDVDRLLENVGGRPVDLLVTHTAPLSIINTFSPLSKEFWELPDGWVDISSKRVDQAMQRISFTNISPVIKVVCGHLHRSATWYNTRVLDINEVWEWRTV